MSPSERAGGRQRDPKTDTALIEAVLDLVSEGATLSGLSLVAIAQHAGVSRNSLYRRWSTKEALYLDVLDSTNRPLPDSSGPTAFDDVVSHLATLVERTADKRASRMQRALLAEVEVFPELYRRYLEEIVGPRRAAMYQALRGGIESGEIRTDTDVVFMTEVLVAPILARMATGVVDDLEPIEMSRRITQLVFDGARPRETRS